MAFLPLQNKVQISTGAARGPAYLVSPLATQAAPYTLQQSYYIHVHTDMPAPPGSILEDSSEWLPPLKSYITTRFPLSTIVLMSSSSRSVHLSLLLDGNVSRTGTQSCSYPSPFYYAKLYRASGGYQSGCLLFLGTWEEHTFLLPGS